MRGTGTGRVRVALAACLLLGAAGCSDDAPTPPPQADPCGIRTQLLAETVKNGPNLAATPRAELESLLARNLELLSRLVRATDGPLRNDLQAEVEVRTELRQRMLDSWGTGDGDRLKEAATEAGFVRIRDYLLRDGVMVGDRTLTSSELDTLGTRNELRLAVRCNQLEPVEAGDVTSARPLPAGVLAIDLGEGGLVRVDRSDGTEARVPGPAGWRVIRQAKASPDGGSLAFLALSEEQNRADVFVGTTADPAAAQPLTALTAGAACFDWAPAGDRIVASVGSSWNNLSVQLFTSGGAPTEVPVEDIGSVAFDCPTFLDATTLLVDTGEPDRVLASIRSVPVAGGPSRPFVSVPDCTSISGAPVAARQEVLFLVRCPDLGTSGLYRAAADGSDPRLLVPGLIGAFDVTSDGDWVVFAYMEPEGNGTDPVLLALDRRNSTYTKVSGANRSWPTWLEPTAA